MIIYFFKYWESRLNKLFYFLIHIEVTHIFCSVNFGGLFSTSNQTVYDPPMIKIFRVAILLLSLFLIARPETNLDLQVIFS